MILPDNSQVSPSVIAWNLGVTVYPCVFFYLALRKSDMLMSVPPLQHQKDWLISIHKGHSGSSVLCRLWTGLRPFKPGRFASDLSNCFRKQLRDLFATYLPTHLTSPLPEAATLDFKHSRLNKPPLYAYTTWQTYSGRLTYVLFTQLSSWGFRSLA